MKKGEAKCSVRLILEGFTFTLNQVGHGIRDM